MAYKIAGDTIISTCGKTLDQLHAQINNNSNNINTNATNINNNTQLIGKKTIIKTPNTSGQMNLWYKIFEVDIAHQYQSHIIKLDVYLVGEGIGFFTIFVRLYKGGTPKIEMITTSPFSYNMRDWYVYYDDAKSRFELWKTNPAGGYNFSWIEAYDYNECDVVGGSQNPINYNTSREFGTPTLPNYVKMDVIRKDIASWEIIPTDEFINGKRVYMKRLEFTDTFTADAPLTKAHGISNVGMIWVDTANSFMFSNNTDGKLAYPVPGTEYYGNFDDKTGVSVDKTNIYMYAQSGWGSGWTKFVTLKFTYA